MANHPSRDLIRSTMNFSFFNIVLTKDKPYLDSKSNSATYSKTVFSTYFNSANFLNNTNFWAADMNFSSTQTLNRSQVNWSSKVAIFVTFHDPIA